MPKFKQNSINLLEPIGLPSDTWSSIYNWVFKIGRYILLAIEIIVLVVFFSRFVLDKQNNDLTSEINDKVQILSNSVFRAEEVRFKNLQALFTDINNVTTKQDIGSEKVATIMSGVPSMLTLDKFSYDANKVNMSVLGSDLEVIKNYEFSLRQNPDYKNVVVSITKTGSSSSLFDVSITFNINKAGN